MLNRDLTTWSLTASLTRRANLIALVLLMGLASALWGSARDNSPTADEPMHMVRGLAIWWEGDTRHSYAHPPLANLWAAAPAALLFDESDLTKLPGWRSGDTAKLAKAYMAADYEKGRAQLVTARLSIAVLTLLFAAYIYNYSRRRFGSIYGLGALALVSFHPAVLAHGSLVTTDMAITVWLLMTCAELVSAVEKKSRTGVVRVALVFSFALLTKHSAALLAPLLVAALASAAYAKLGIYSGLAARTRTLLVTRQTVLAVSLCIFMVNLGFGFERSFMRVDEMLQEEEPRNWITRGYKGTMLEKGILGQLPAEFRVPVPYTYVVGLDSIRAHNARGHRSWFMGEIGNTGWSSYFPILVLIKTPVSVFLFLVFGAWLVWRRGAVAPPTFFFAIVSILLLMSIMPARLNIGSRHALPIMVLWSVLAGWGAGACLHLGVNRFVSAGDDPEIRKWARIFCIAVCIALLLPGISVLRAHPSYISQFNEIIGPKLGHQISIIGEDWGQDDAAFAEYALERKLRPLYFQRYAFTGIRELKRKKVPFRRLRCKKRPQKTAWVAIHASNYLRTKERCFSWLGEQEPDEIFRDHIYLFHYVPPKVPKSKKK